MKFHQNNRACPSGPVWFSLAENTLGVILGLTCDLAVILGLTCSLCCGLDSHSLPFGPSLLAPLPLSQGQRSMWAIGKGDGFQAFLFDCFPITLSMSNPISSSLHSKNMIPILKNLMPTPAFSPPPVSNILFPSATPFSCPGHSAPFFGVLSHGLLWLPPSVAMHSISFKLMPHKYLLPVCGLSFH